MAWKGTGLLGVSRDGVEEARDMLRISTTLGRRGWI